MADPITVGAAIVEAAIESTVTATGVAANIAVPTVEVGTAAASTVTAAAGVAEAGAVLPSAVEAVSMGGENVSEVSVSLLSETGPRIAAVVDALPKESALEELSAAKVDGTIIKDAFSPFREMSEEQFAQEFPELAGDESSKRIQKESRGKVIAINEQAARELEVQPYEREQKARISGDLHEGEEILLKEKNFEETLKDLDLPDDMREKLPSIIEMLRDHPDLMEALGKVQKLDQNKKDELIAKINKLIKDETDPEKQSLLMLLLSMLLGFLITTNGELNKQIPEAA